MSSVPEQESSAEPESGSYDSYLGLISNCIFGTLIVLVFLGNLFVIILISTTKKLHNYMNLFAMWVAIADIILSIIVMPVEIIKTVPGDYLHCWMCKACHFSIICSNSFCMVLISIDTIQRYYRVINNKIIISDRISFIVAIAASIAVVYAARMLYYADGFKGGETNDCILYGSHTEVLAWNIADIIVFCVLPLAIVIGFNGMLMRQIKVSLSNEDKIMLPYILLSTSSFFVCVLPINIYTLIFLFYTPDNSTRAHTSTRLGLTALSFIPAILDVVFLTWTNSEFRQELMNTIQCKTCKKTTNSIMFLSAASTKSDRREQYFDQTMYI